MLATFRTLFVDKEAEQLQFLTRDFKGVAEAVELLRHNLQAASGLPPAVFEGQFPSGLGATGISERLQWADQVRAFQESHWRRPIEQMVRLLFRTGIPEPEYWHWEWNSVFQLTDEELVRLRSLQAQTDATYLREGVLLPEEVAQSRFGGSNYSFETVLDKKLRETKDPLVEADPFAEAGDIQGLVEASPGGL
jgi:phage-related protein (TIGR01555 family)